MMIREIVKVYEYCDVDYVGCPIDRSSTTEYFVFIGGNLTS